MRLRAHRATRAAALVLLGLVAAGCFLFPQAVKRETLLLPVVESEPPAGEEGSYVVQENGNISWELSGLRIEVDHMTDAELNELFPEESVRGKYSTNPYTYGNWVDTRMGYTPNRFTVFKVTVFNRTLPKVMLNPLAAVVETDQGQFLRSYGITSASPYQNFENYYRSRRGQSGNEFYRFELRMGMVRSYNYEENQPIFKGENYGGFIVFDPVYSETKEVVLTLEDFVLRFGAFDAPAEVRDLRFDFRHQVEERVLQTAAVAQGTEERMVSEQGPRQVVGNLPGDRLRDASAVQALVRQNLKRIDRCFAEAFDKGDASEGELEVRFIIEVGGPISKVEIVESSVASAAVEECVAQEVGRWTFRPIDVAALQLTPLPVTVTYPFSFSVGVP